MQRYNLEESSIIGSKFKGFTGDVDFLLSYVWGIDGLPFINEVKNRIFFYK